MELHTLNLQKGMDLGIGDIEDIWIKEEIKHEEVTHEEVTHEEITQE